MPLCNRNLEWAYGRNDNFKPKIAKNGMLCSSKLLRLRQQTDAPKRKVVPLLPEQFTCLSTEGLLSPGNTENNKRTAGVVVSYKIPILVTRVRFPGSAMFSEAYWRF